MDLSGIISISGKPGLYKMVAQTKNGIIVQGMDDNKRFPAYATDRISALEDISIYTHEGDVPLGDVYRAIFEKEDAGKAINPKSSGDELRGYLEAVLPGYDQERVYSSDIKKMMTWYNMLHASDMLKLKSDAEDSADETEEAATEETEAAAEATETSDDTAGADDAEESTEEAAK